MGGALTITVRSERGVVIAAVTGEIDISTVAGLRERLFELANHGATLIVDLNRVTSSIRPGWVPWSVRLAAPLCTAAACTRSAPGRRPASCCG
jgi:hypothetical protein